MSLLSANLWKGATLLAALVSLVLAGGMIYVNMQNKEIAKQRDNLQAQITDPVTGYVARLTQANANVVQLKATITTQNAAYEQLSAQSKAQLAESRRLLAVAQGRTRVMEAQLARFMERGPQGNTLEERVLDVDRRAIEEFLQ